MLLQMWAGLCCIRASIFTEVCRRDFRQAVQAYCVLPSQLTTLLPPTQVGRASRPATRAAYESFRAGSPLIITDFNR